MRYLRNIIGALLLVSSGLSAQGDTMFIEGRHLYSSQGEEVVLRGVNEMFVWSDDKTGIKYLPEIAQTGANCVRLVWTEDYGKKHNLVELMENCIDHHMIAMPECHSATGEWNKLDICVNFWKDPVLLEGIQANRKWTLLNIGNEVGNGSVTKVQFLSGYMDAIDSLRGWGYTVPLVIDAPNWGQNLAMIISAWEEIQDHDPLHNILFSVHSYWAGTSNYQLLANEAIKNDLPIIVGEGPSPTSYPSCNILDYKTGMDILGRNEIGWLSWSWGGMANGHCVPNFDHTYGGVFGKWRTSYASQMMAEHQYSLMRTAQRPASMYQDGRVKGSGIYISPEIDEIAIGDSLLVEVLISPLNAKSQTWSMSMEGDEGIIVVDSVGYLKALGEGSILLTVSLDENPEISFSREISVVDPLGIPQVVDAHGIKIYPNPNEGVLYVESEFSNPVELKILDLSGRLMIFQEYQGNIELDTRSLSAGPYMLVFSHGGELVRRKLIIL